MSFFIAEKLLMPVDMSVTVPCLVFLSLVAIEHSEDALGLAGTSLAFGMGQCF